MKIVCNLLRSALLLLAWIAWGGDITAQKLINYTSGMGTRDIDNPNVWILYQGVRAEHDGMLLFADSALLDMEKNDFTAFGNIEIVISDTTTIWGDQLYYDGNERIAHVWDDTVVLVDGETVLLSPQLKYDRNTSIASYSRWGHGVNNGRILDSKNGMYNSETDIFFAEGDVVLMDSSSRLETDSIYYNTQTTIANIVCATHIYQDTSMVYSELGSYNSSTGMAISEKGSYLVSGSTTLDCDLLHYYEKEKKGYAWGNVVIIDTSNDIICTSKYGTTDQRSHESFVTDSALVKIKYEKDTIWIHADTLFIVNDSADKLKTLRAFYHVKVYRNDAQGKCDSLFYQSSDSIADMFGSPIMWYEYYQCTADTISVKHDSAGICQTWFRTNAMAVEKVDMEKYNQLKGKQGVAYFTDGEPSYVDILGNSQMVYYVTDEDAQGRKSLIGVNAGVGADMRIYIKNQKPIRMVTYSNPDMHTYPLNKLPQEEKQLKGFSWQESSRPRKPLDVMTWE